MVKSYDRYEQEGCFGVISSQSNAVWIPLEDKGSKSAGYAITSGLEEVLVWDIKTGELKNRLSEGITPGASNAPTAQTPAGVSRIAHHEAANITAAGYHDGTIKIWDMASGSVVMTFKGHKSSITAMKFDKNGTRVVSGSSDATIIFWDLVNEEGLFKLKGHKGPITGMSLLTMDNGSENDLDDMDDFFLSVSKDGLIKLWDLKSQQCIETHIAHSNECWSLGVGPSQDFAITSGNSDQVKVWNIDLTNPDTKKITEKGSFEKQSKARCTDIVFQEFKSLWFFFMQNTDRTIEIFRIRTEQEIKKGISKRSKRLQEKGYTQDEILSALEESEVNMTIASFAVLRTSSKIKSCTWAVTGNKKLNILVSLNNNSLEYHNFPMPDDVRKSQNSPSVKVHTLDHLGHRSDIRAMDVSSDDRLLVTASNGELKIWNLKSKNVIRSFDLESGYALCCKFLPGGTLVVVGFKNGDIELYDLAKSELIDRIEQAHQNANGEGASVWSLDITSDGTTMVSGGNDKSVKFWNFTPEQEIVPGSGNVITKLKLTHKQTLELNEDVLCVRISPESKFLAISLLNNNVQVIFFDSLKLFLTLYGHKLPVLSIDISHDSKLIITSSADKNIKIWGLDFGDCHRSIFGHQDSIMNVKFIPESHNFFSSSKDGMVKYWDGDKFECIQKLPAHQSEIWCLAMSSDGSFVVSTSHDHSIRLWLATDDQVFLEEEREKEMEELYENTLLDSLEDTEGRKADDDEEPSDEMSKVTNQSMESLKAGERLMEALEIGTQDLEATEQYHQQLAQYNAKKTLQKPVMPTPHTILAALGVSGQKYVLDVLLKIRSSQLEDALLVLPFSFSLRLLRFIEIWTNEINITSNIVNISLICRVLFFVIRANARELVNQKDPHIKNQLVRVKSQLRAELTRNTAQLGFNTRGLNFVKSQWNLTHRAEFIDHDEQAAYNDKSAPKRSYLSI